MRRAWRPAWPASAGMCAGTSPERARRAEVEVRRPPGPPGAEAQVDYGYLGAWFDPRAGRRRRVWAFSMVLRYSRHLFVRPVIRMDQRAWTESHVQAFEFFGGCPARLVSEYVPRNIFAVLCRPTDLCRHWPGCCCVRFRATW